MDIEPCACGRGFPTLVVVGVLCQGGKILIARRPEGNPGARLWEFPGCEIEAGEGPVEALRRELAEEPGIFVSDADLISFAYDPQLVPLLFAFTFREGELERKEGQTIKRVLPGELDQYEMQPLNAELVFSLREFMMGL